MWSRAMMCVLLTLGVLAALTALPAGPARTDDAAVGVPVVAAATATTAAAALSSPSASPVARSSGPAGSGAEPARPFRVLTRILPRRTGGATALRALGSRLPAVAARNGLTPAKLTRTLRHDHTARLDREGDLYFVDGDTAAPAAASTTYEPIQPTSQTFTLHSRPQATRKIFLDFDGATVSGTAWNGTASGDIPDGSHIGLDLDGDPTTFSTAEQGFIQQVWRQVAEIYSPFDVDVTTEDPGLAGLTRSSTGDTSYGTQVLITSDDAPRQAVCGSCLGVAFVGTFDTLGSTDQYQPAWVFDYDDRFDPMVIAQAAAHETGHTVGLSHDGTSTAGYYAGTAAWGPIMGSSMNRAVSQFSKGEYADANNAEDDFAVMQANGLPLRADDHPSSVTTAEALGTHPSYDVSGVIGTRADTDVFSLDLPCTATLTAQARGIGAQTTLDLSLSVLDAQGDPVAVSSPASGHAGSPPTSTGMDAGLSVPAASGIYYLVVDGVGNGSPANGGWSDYGSLGQYTLTASGCSDADVPSATATATPTSGPTPTPTTTPTVSPSTPPTAGPTATPTPTSPSRPHIRRPSSGVRGGRTTATARWLAPDHTGGLPVSGYRLTAWRVGSHGHVVRRAATFRLGGHTHVRQVRLPRGRYRFQVQARTAAGRSVWSLLSQVVTAR